MPTFRTTFDDNTSRVYTKRVMCWTSPSPPAWVHASIGEGYRLINHHDIDKPMRELRERVIKAGGWEAYCREQNTRNGTLAAIDYIAEVYMPSAKTTQTQPCGDVEQTLREAIGYEPTE